MAKHLWELVKFSVSDPFAQLRFLVALALSLCIAAWFVVLALVAIVLGTIFRWRWVRNVWFRSIHFLMIAVVVAQSLLGIICPLTTLEHRLRRAAGETAYDGSFIGHWVHELLFMNAPSWVFALCYCLFGAVVLICFNIDCDTLAAQFPGQIVGHGYIFFLRIDREIDRLGQ